MTSMREFIQDGEILTGDDILSGNYHVEIHVPKIWTAEYVAYRLKEAFETLRRANVGRIFPGSAAGFWPEILREADDIRGWADEHRKDVESGMARRQARPTSVEIDRMDEALAWPMGLLSNDPLHADAVTLWAFTSAYDIDPAHILNIRRMRAEKIANQVAERETARRKGLARAAGAASAKRMYDKWKVAKRTPEKQKEALALIEEKARIRAMGEYRRLGGDAKPSITAAMPGKVLKPGTLKRVSQEGLALLASRLNESRVPTR